MCEFIVKTTKNLQIFINKRETKQNMIGSFKIDYHWTKFIYEKSYADAQDFQP